jgi:antitoxin ParD1/3/4
MPSGVSSTHTSDEDTIMPTRNVVLNDHHQDVIERLVKSGRYQNASEVLREGLRLVEQREQLDVARLEAIREAARVGFSDLEEGRFADVPLDALGEYIANLGIAAAGRASRPADKDNG